MRWRWLPLLMFGALGLALWLALTQGPVAAPVTQGAGLRVAIDRLQPLDGFTPLRAADLAGVTVVNIFASWCPPCLVEHPLLLQLGQRVPLHGVGYRDTPTALNDFLGRLGNPYRTVSLDAGGQLALSIGMSGVPETLVLVDGVVHWHWRGPLTATVLQQELYPLLVELRR